MKEIFDILFLPEIKVDDYEYIFNFNDKMFETKECYNNSFDGNYCVYEGKNYYNVSYETHYIGSYYEFNPIFLPSITIIFVSIFCLVLKILFSFSH